MPVLPLEELITLTEAARTLPRRRGGRPTHASTLFRWATEGLRGVRLEVVQVGGTKCTSRGALARFFARLTAASAPADQGLGERGVVPLDGLSDAQSQATREATHDDSAGQNPGSASTACTINSTLNTGRTEVDRG